MKYYLWWAIGGLAAVIGPWLIYEFVCYEGRRDLTKIAREKGFCTTDDCVEGSNEVHAILERSTGASSTKLDWCVGVASIAQVRVYRGGWLKSLAVDTMNYPCLGLFDKKPT